MIRSDEIFSISSPMEFEQLAFKVFKFQFENNPIYRSFCDLLYINPADVNTVSDIPFLPIQFFKTHRVLSTNNPVQMEFTSSGTGSNGLSTHFVTDLTLYSESFTRAFEYFYGPVSDYTILALLPSYLDREGSSLIFMVDQLIKRTGVDKSGFYLDDLNSLASTLERLDEAQHKVLLIGVSFALLDLIDIQQFQLKNTVVMETGGMKGRRKEIIREDLHKRLKEGFGIETVHSEYGMTELLSQAYSKGNSIFRTPPWMKIFSRDTEDPKTILSVNKTGGLNVIDLANINSCSFIATQDLVKMHPNGSFEILGRFDNSDIRGCNLMII